MSSERRKLFLVVIVCAAATAFMVRGPLRLARHADFNDFISPYAQSRGWLHGMNPYAPYTLLRFWPVVGPETDFLQAGIADGSLVARHGLPSPYPPTTFVILAPFAVLPWHAALFSWSAVTIAAFALAVSCLASLGSLHRSAALRLWFIALALASAPVHSGLATANPSILTVAIGIIAIWLVQQERPTWGGVLTGVALCLKPPLGLGFLLFLAVSRRWRAVLVSLACIATIALVAIARMEWIHPDWFAGYVDLSRGMFSSGGVNDPTSANVLRFSMVNLQVLLSALGASRRITGAAAWLIAAAMGVVWLYFASKRNCLPVALSAGTILILLLLPTYHRHYDAAVILLTFAWALDAWDGPRRTPARIALLLTLPFLLPGPLLLENFVEAGLISHSISQCWWWNGFVMTHQIWVLSLLSLVMLYAMASTEEPIASESQGKGALSVDRCLNTSRASS